MSCEDPSSRTSRLNDLHEKAQGLVTGDIDAIDEFAEELLQARRDAMDVGQDETAPSSTSSAGSNSIFPDRINASEATIDQGLAKLVLTLIEILRQVLEKQAVRRIESGSLTDDEIERMGETFMKLEARMVELREAFGLENEELDLNLGSIRDIV